MGGMQYYLFFLSFQSFSVSYLAILHLCLQDPTFSYPHFVQLLQFSCYSTQLLSGLVIAIGGLQDSLRKTSLTALLDYLCATKGDEESISREISLSINILWVLEQHKRCDRVIVPTLKVI